MNNEAENLEKRQIYCEKLPKINILKIIFVHFQHKFGEILVIIFFCFLKEINI